MSAVTIPASFTTMPEVTIAKHAVDALRDLVVAFQSPPHNPVHATSHKIDDQTELRIIATVLKDGYWLGVAVHRINN